MTSKLVSYCCGIAIGSAVALSQRMSFFANNVEVACDISVNCLQASAFNISELDERVGRKIRTAATYDFSARFYTSPGRIGCIYSFKGTKDDVRIIEQAVLAELKKSAGTTNTLQITKRRIESEY